MDISSVGTIVYNIVVVIAIIWLVRTVVSIVRYLFERTIVDAIELMFTMVLSGIVLACVYRNGSIFTVDSLYSKIPANLNDQIMSHLPGWFQNMIGYAFHIEK